MTFVRASALVLLGLGAGVLAVQLSLPQDAPLYADRMGSIHRYWYMGRASGFIAYGLLTASVVLGIGISSRVFDGLLVRPWVFEMHQFLSIIVLLVMAFHALILLPDPYAQFRLTELLVPFASHYRPLSVGLGVIALYGTAIVTTSFYIKRLLGQRAWRTLHYLSFALFAMATAHGVYAGTDSGVAWAQAAYLASALGALFLVFFRILATRSAARAAAVPERGRARAA